jgi:hypothetical protein
MSTLKELQNLAMEEAKQVVEEMIMKLDPDKREQARKDIASPDFHPYTIKVLARSRKKKMEVQGTRIRRDKYKIEPENENNESANQSNR